MWKILIALLSLGLVVGCSEEANRAGGPPQAYPYRAVTTVGMLADVVRAVAGDRAEVRSLVGTGIDPHTYSPTTSDVKSLQQADIIFYNGLLLEGKMTETLARLGERGQPVIAAAEQLSPDFLLHPDGTTGHADPHVWMDVQGWIQVTQVVSAALAKYDPANAAGYESNASAYIEQLRRLDEYAKKSIASIPTPGANQKPVLITAHDAFSYFGRAYNMEVHGIQGVSTESEAGLQDIQRLIDLIVQRDVKAVFVETSVADKYVRSLVDGAAARGKTITIGGSLFSDAMGQEGTYEGTYIGMIDHNVTMITRALGGEAPEKGMDGKLSAGG
jgi:manganese/zinc/iron transport system substrate-binding protein